MVRVVRVLLSFRTCTFSLPSQIITAIASCPDVETVLQELSMVIANQSSLPSHDVNIGQAYGLPSWPQPSSQQQTMYL